MYLGHLFDFTNMNEKRGRKERKRREEKKSKQCGTSSCQELFLQLDPLTFPSN
jgi:hypothetical protein